MATINIPDPSVTLNATALVQSSGGDKSVTVRLPSGADGGLPPASFGPEEFSGPEQAANQAVLAALLTKAKTRWQAIAADNGNTINWT